MEMSTHARAGERDQSHYMHIVILCGNGTVRVNYVHMHTYRVPAPVLSALFPPLLFCPWVRALSECSAPAQRFLRASLLCMEQDRGYGHHLSAACCMLACRLSLIHSFILQIIFTRHHAGHGTQKLDKTDLAPALLDLTVQGGEWTLSSPITPACTQGEWATSGTYLPHPPTYRQV